MARNKSPFKDFTALSSTGKLHLYTPNTAASTTSSVPSHGSAPELVIISTWMGGLPKHITKYIDAYRKLYPAAMLLIQTNSVADIMMRPNWTQQRRMEPAVDVVRNVHENKPEPENGRGKILLHMFSNGGCQQAIQLAKQYSKATGEQLPVSAMVIDSAPGTGTWRDGAAAFLLAFPPHLRWMAQPVVYLALGTLWIWTTVLRLTHPIDWIQDGLLDEELFTKSAPRVYLYSKSDELVPWTAVVRAAGDAAFKGWDVETLEFEGTAHVNHMAKDPERYWAAVNAALAERNP